MANFFLFDSLERTESDSESSSRFPFSDIKHDYPLDGLSADAANEKFIQSTRRLLTHLRTMSFVFGSFLLTQIFHRQFNKAR
jgi:hypothetical protein